MAFHHKLDWLLAQMNCSNANLARTASLDASIVSRFRTGARIPTQNSKQLENLYKGLILLAESRNQTHVLLNVLGHSSADLSNSALYESLFRWMGEQDSMLKPERQHSRNSEQKKKNGKRAKPLKGFAKKLDILMKALHVSNIQLARFLNVDASLISRFRSGMRTLSTESQFISNICTYFSSRTKTHGQVLTLLEILSISKGADSYLNNPRQLFDDLYHWLTKNQDITDNSVVNNLLEKLDTFQAQWNITHLLPELVPVKEGAIHSIESFWGIHGIQQAVIRFLTLTASQNTPRTLYLYSDHPINWMTSDMNFTKTWASLMLTVLAKGCKVKIIHNVERDFSELFSAIEKWLPLYMTGQIEPYYHKRGRDIRFYRTMFIASDLALINSTCVAGTEEHAEYIFNTESRQIKQLTEEFQYLLSSCNSLMQIFTPQTADQYLLRLAEFERQDVAAKALLPSPSICTIPLGLLKSILDRTNTPIEQRQKILFYHENRRERFYKYISSNNMTELVALATTEQLYAGMICIDLPKFIFDTPIYYTPREYSEHMKSIVQILNQNSHYHFCPYHSSPFRNIQIIAKEGVSTMILINDNPATTFIINHPLMCSAFSGYLEALFDNNMKGNRSSIIAELTMNYINS